MDCLIYQNFTVFLEKLYKGSNTKNWIYKKNTCVLRDYADKIIELR